jgi:hypothetical protein
MPELVDREQDEQRLALMLLLMFESESMGFWLQGFHSPEVFSRKIRELGMQHNLLDMSIRVRNNMLSDLRYEIDAIAMNRRMAALAEQYRFELATRLSYRHQEWLQEQTRARADRARRRRAGESIQDPRLTPRDIYSDADAARESATAVTNWVSRVEMNIRDTIEDLNGISLVGIWNTEPGACPVCEPLHKTTEDKWRSKFKTGPPAHPNCRCWLQWRELIE